jgi:CDP-diacylglycerol--glycerol-3-phosphate 3-phosphatidyltransferase/cardiolipin synthase
VLYCIIAITDFFDGYLARAQGTVSKLGIFLDPIADKIMVAAVILVLTAQGFLRGPYVGDVHVIAGLVILVREIAVSGLREFLGGIQVSVPVSKLAKWKTTFQLVSLGALILGGAVHGQPCQAVGDMCKTVSQSWVHLVGLGALWAAAVLTCITGWDYLRVGLKHMD